jgi:hypothetical protein
MCEVNGRHHRSQCRSGSLTEEEDLVLFQVVRLRLLGQLARKLARNLVRNLARNLAS